MNSEEPPPEQPPRPPSSGGMEGLDPAELLARALHTVQPSAGQAAWIPPEPEELARLLPQYGIESLLGHGGMGAVYKGRQPDLDRPVAIKLLPAEIAADEQFIARFRREARTLAKLQHPGIVSVYDFGQTSAGHLYFVMEFVEGTDLQKILRGPGLDPAQALNVISQVCDALHYAHSKGVIHRDIKPGNILVSSEGYVKLADFGLARPIQEDSTVLTGRSVMMGTFDYMAPEQRDGHADQRADIYALGVMLYEMLTGKRPHGVFDPPSHRVQVDIRLDGVVLKALQQEPERRYQQVSQMKTDVDEIRTTPPPSSTAETEPQPASPPIRPAARPRRPVAAPNPARPRAVSPGHPSPAATLKTTHSSNHTILILGIVALLTIGGLAMFLASQNRGNIFNNITNQIIHNNYFTQLFASGVTTEKDLQAIAEIRPYGKGFIGISKEPLMWEQAQDLAKRTGSAVLAADGAGKPTEPELIPWLLSTFSKETANPLWVTIGAIPAVLDGGRPVYATNSGGAKRVVIRWQTDQEPAAFMSWVNPTVLLPDADGWITLFDGVKLYGCSPDAVRKAGDKVKIQDGALLLNDSWVQFQINARNVSVRADVKKISGINLGLGLREGPGNKKLSSWFNGGGSKHGNFGLGMTDPKFRDLKTTNASRDFAGFFQMELIAQDNTITLRVENETVATAENNEVNDPGMISVRALKGESLFKKIQARILDNPPR